MAETVLLSWDKNKVENLNIKDESIRETAKYLRYFIHVLGDIHQPLHAASLYSEDNISDDRGGNQFNIKYQYNSQTKITNLHALFDSGINEWNKEEFFNFFEFSSNHAQVNN